MKNTRLFLPLTFALVLSGCGGDSSGDGVARFAGSYTGTYASTSTTNNDQGTLAVTIASDGTITGTATDSRYGDSGTVTVPGSLVQSGGTTTLALRFAVSGAPVGTTTTFRGRLIREDAATIAGTLNERQGDIDVPFDFVLTRIID